MTNKPKISISWSGGKDSAMALHKVLSSGEYEVIELHTVFEKDSKRVGIHNIPEYFIEEQANRLNLPLTKLYLEKKPMAYQKLMTDYYRKLKGQGIDYVMFGDIFLEDLKDFREMLLKSSDVQGVYPLWKAKSNDLVNDFFDLGFETILCAVDSKYINEEHCGKFLTSEFIDNHPKIDPCGENGEYHSFVVNGPLFSSEISVDVINTYAHEHTFKVKDQQGGEQEMKELFYYADLELSRS